LFFVLHAVILVLDMVFQVTVREESDVGACLWIWRWKGLRVWNVPSYTHLRQNALPDASRQTMRLWAQFVVGLCQVIGSVL